MESREVDGGGLVVSGGQAAPLLELVDAALDGVAPLVGLTVERRRAAPEAAQPLAIGDLVGGLRDHRPDPAPTEMGANRAGRVRLVREDYVGCRPGSADRSRNPNPCHDLCEFGCVTGLARSNDERERSAAAVGREVDLRGQAAAGASDGVIVRLADWSPF